METAIQLHALTKPLSFHRPLFFSLSLSLFLLAQRLAWSISLIGMRAPRASRRCFRTTRTTARFSDLPATASTARCCPPSTDTSKRKSRSSRWMRATSSPRSFRRMSAACGRRRAVCTGTAVTGSAGSTPWSRPGFCAPTWCSTSTAASTWLRSLMNRAASGATLLRSLPTPLSGRPRRPTTYTSTRTPGV